MLARWIVFGITFAGVAFSQQLARDFFDDTVVHEIRLEMDPSDWAALKANYLEDTYYKGNVSSGGQSAAQVGIRSRGRGSRSPVKPNLDINVDKYVKHLTFADLPFFILKANNQDASLMHELVTLKLFKMMGLPAPREAPARVYMNGDYLGFYVIVEHEDEDFLDRNFGEDKGDLFEWKPNDYFHFEDLGTDPAKYAIFLDPKTNEDNPDLTKFVDLVQAVNHSSDADFVSAVSQYLDLKLYLTHAATENATAELDGLWGDTYGTNNIFLYRFNKQNLFQLIVWDKDLTFLQPVRDVFQSVQANVLARRLLAIPEYRTYYLSQLTKAVDLMGGAGGWADREVNRLNALFREDALNDPNKQCILADGSISGCAPNAYDQGVAQMHAFLAVRQTFVHNELASLNYQAPAAGTHVDSVTFESVTGGSQLVPGSLARIRGVGFGGDLTPTGDDSLPRWNGRSFVAVEGVRAPIVSMGPSEVLIQIPWDIPTGSAAIAVAGEGAISNTVETAVVPTAPVIQAIVHANGSAVTAENPASPGEMLAVYATGLGAVESTVVTGDPAPLNELIRTVATPTIRIGPDEPTILFSGLSPGFVGLYQINLVLPAGISAGSATLTVATGGETASANLTIH